MAILAKNRISLKADAKDKTEAIRLAGNLLVDSGCVLPGYVDGMLNRERSMSTSLGIGVAIPHGMDENREQVLSTGISVVQLANGIEWEEGDVVSLVIGIAANSEEHVGVLASLAEVVEDEDSLSQMMQTDDPDVIIQYLSSQSGAE